MAELIQISSERIELARFLVQRAIFVRRAAKRHSYQANISGAPLDESNQEYKALKMSGKIEKQLQQIHMYNRLDSMEKKLQNVEGVLAQISSLEKSLNNVLNKR